MYASRAARRLEAGQWAFLAIILVATGAISVGQGFVWLAVLGLLLGFGCSVLAARALRLGLRIGPTEVDIRNLLRRYRLPWHEIEAIGWTEAPVMASQYSVVDRPVVAFRLASGSLVTVEATFALRPAQREALVAELASYAHTASIVITVAPDDLRSYWLWRRTKPAHPQLERRRG